MKLSIIFLIVNIALNKHLSYLRTFCLVPPLPFDDNTCNPDSSFEFFFRLYEEGEFEDDM